MLCLNGTALAVETFCMEHISDFLGKHLDTLEKYRNIRLYELATEIRCLQLRKIIPDKQAEAIIQDIASI